MAACEKTECTKIKVEHLGHNGIWLLKSVSPPTYSGKNIPTFFVFRKVCENTKCNKISAKHSGYKKYGCLKVFVPDIFWE